MIVYEMVAGAEITQTTSTAQGGMLQVQASGTFGGAVLSLLISQDGLGYVAASDYERVESSLLLVQLKSGSKYKFEANSATVATSISVSVLK